MSYVNVGVTHRVSGERVKTKSALLKAIKAGEAAEFLFDPTSPMGPVTDQIDGASVPANVKLSVVGPCPFTKRNWYATVEIKNGKVVAS